MPGYRRPLRANWTIMNANVWIGGKPSIEKIIRENQRKGTIMVIQKEGKPFFVLGARGNYGEVGEDKSYVRDTGNGIRPGGMITIENRIQISEDKIIDPGNGIGVTERRALYVFE